MSGISSLSQDALALIGLCIRSVWTLEVLRLAAEGSGRSWREDEIVRELRASGAVVRDAIEALATAGLLRRGPDGEVAYAPQSGALDRAAGELVRALRERPVAVMKAIASAPDERIRTFANAFRIMK